MHVAHTQRPTICSRAQVLQSKWRCQPTAFFLCFCFVFYWCCCCFSFSACLKLFNYCFPHIFGTILIGVVVSLLLLFLICWHSVWVGRIYGNAGIAFVARFASAEWLSLCAHIVGAKIISLLFDGLPHGT